MAENAGEQGHHGQHSSGHGQHHLEFGGSPVGEDFDGRISFRRVERIPVITVSQTFGELTARQIRYHLVATVGAERPFYQRYQYAIIDLRMVTGWEDGAAGFLGQLRDRLREIGGELFLVTYDASVLPGEFKVYDSMDDAVAAARQLRAENRAASLERVGR